MGATPVRPFIESEEDHERIDVASGPVTATEGCARDQARQVPVNSFQRTTTNQLTNPWSAAGRPRSTIHRSIDTGHILGCSPEPR
ncbi:hypothetical protein [Streptomyces cyaneofuscatus]|uniref:hypothetical protein n=1 Tax=Streptomyces cyaneofuscatus TaxID=66883 RepID=UPI0038263C3C